MSSVAIIIVFFLLVLAAVLFVGSWWMDRRREEGDYSDPLLLKAFETVGKNVPEKPEKAVKARTKLTYAGYRSPSAHAIYQGVCTGAGLLLALCVALAGLLQNADATPIFVASVCGFAFGYLLPERVLDFLVRRRADLLRRGLPQCIDMMILGMDAGQSVDTVLSECSREMRPTCPELAAELRLILIEAASGKSRAESFRALAERNVEPEIKRFSQVLIDCDRFGTGLAAALRTHVKYLRIRGRQKARESARKVGTKLVFPVFFLIFPTILLVTLGPAVLRLQETLPAMMGAGK